MSNIALVMTGLEEYIMQNYGMHESLQPHRPQADTPPKEWN